MNFLKLKRGKYHPSMTSVVIGVVIGLLLWFAETDENKRDPQIVVALSIFLVFLVEVYVVTKDIPYNSTALDKIGEEMQGVDRFVKNLATDKKRVSEIEGHLFGRENMVRDFGFKIWNDYLNAFEITEGGISLEGEELSVKTAVKLWRLLSSKQMSNTDKPIIARITHSNDISIWLPEEKEAGNELYIFQQQFVANGGIIVRFLIGPTKEPDERYRRAMKRMEDIGIEVRYFYIQEVGEKDFDFLYLHDEQFVLKWYSGIQGKNLVGCFISDKQEEEIINRWAALFLKAKNEGKPITKIPIEREFYA